MCVRVSVCVCGGGAVVFLLHLFARQEREKEGRERGKQRERERKREVISLEGKGGITPRIFCPYSKPAVVLPTLQYHEDYSNTVGFRDYVQIILIGISLRRTGSGLPGRKVFIRLI